MGCRKGGSIRRLDPKEPENALELGVAEEGDLQGAFALGVAQLDFGAEALAQLVFEVGDVGVPGLAARADGLWW